MFEIEYKGGNTVNIITKQATLVFDPKLSVVGLKDKSIKDSIEIATEARFALDSTEAKLCIEGPGEYELSGYMIKGIAAKRHIDSGEDAMRSTIYRIEIGDVNLAVVGNIDAKLSEDQLEEIGLVDVLVVPVGGSGYTLDATSAASLARSIEPKAVIPVHYADTALTYEVPQDSLQAFTSELGAPVETTPKYKLKASNNLPEVMTVIEVTRS